MTTATRNGSIRHYYRGPLTSREECYDVWFPLFGSMVSATVIIDAPWFIENPYHSMMLTDVEWEEWDRVARDIVATHRAEHGDVLSQGQ